MKKNHFLRLLAVALVAIMASASPTWAYYAPSTWKYSTTAKDNGQDSDGGEYTFRYQTDNTKKNFMDFRTYYKFDVSKHMYKWNWDIRVNYGTVDDKNSTHVVVTIEDADGYRMDIAEADFVGYQTPTVNWSTRPVYFSRIKDEGTFKYMFTLEYQPTEWDLRDGVRKIYIACCTTWDNGNEVRNFQYERDLDISSYKNMTPKYNVELDDEGNYVFKVSGTPATENNTRYLDRYFDCMERYSTSSYTARNVFYHLNAESRSGGTDQNAEYTFTIPVKSYTVPLHLYLLDYTADVKRHTMRYTGNDHYKYTLHAASGNDYKQGIMFQPYTRVDVLTAEFDKWKKQNVIQWTRTQSITEEFNGKMLTTECQTNGTWYVLRYEQGRPVNDYEVLKEISGTSSKLKVEDENIDYDKIYVYRVVFLPDFLKEKFENKLTELPGEGDVHTKYDLWEEATVNTKMEVPIKLAQDRSDLSGIHLTWEYNVQLSGCEWRIDKRRLGTTTWTPLTTLPIDINESSASYLESGGSVCDQFVYRIMTTINGKELYSDTLVCNLPAGAYISEVKATTGTEEKFVEVKWKVERPGDDDILYSVLRRPIGTSEWTLLTDEIKGHQSEYTYKDDRVMAGSYYEYSVEAYGAKCAEQLVKTDAQVTPGFSQARGTITGHISYGTGTAVAGARVSLVKSSVDATSESPQFLSRHITGEGKGLTWIPADDKEKDKLNGQKPLTLQLWFQPMSANGAAVRSLCRLNNALELGMETEDGTHYFLRVSDFSGGASGSVQRFPDLKFDNSDFTHLAAVYDNGQWTFYVGSDTLRSATMNVSDRGWDAFELGHTVFSVGGSNRTMDLSFEGYVDDIRLWSRALSDKEITANYTRILGGSEDGLFLYWPLDEGINIVDYAFDVARQDGIYQLNHPEVGINARPSALVPELLKLYGLTDAEGDYIIRGVPFQQGGTNYKLVPSLGIHQFNPNTRSMFVSPTSPTANNIDFEDVSSFPMAGYVYYAGTNIPAEGVMFYVDGELVTGNGETKKTDANGYYEISVPIGEHYVEAKLDGHTMVEGGRFPTTGVHNFDRALTHDFADSTLVNFVGRVSGGERNDTLAVGFGLSNNNIGMAILQLKLNNESFSFNCQDDHITSATVERAWESDTTSIQSMSWTGTGDNAKYIYIRTDPQTGEFSALLPPLKYSTKSIRVESNPDIEFNTLSEIDLTNVKKDISDSLKVAVEGADSVWQYYKYNTKLVRTYFAEPQIQMWQVNGNGAFGERELKNYSVSSTETTDITDIWTVEDDNSIKYTYEFPIFARNTSYTFKLHGFEAYVNHDSNPAVCDTIPLNGQKLTIENEMSDKQDVVAKVVDPSVTDLKAGDIYNLKRNQLLLDEDGYNEVKFTTGLPNITAPYTRQFRLSFERNKRTYAPIQLNGIVLGELTDGNNFVTQGPDIVSMVLRDPPGSKSKTTWKTGTINTKIENRIRKWSASEQLSAELIWGSRLMQGVGMGVMIVTTTNVNTIATVGEKGTGEWTTKTDKTWVKTTANSISTGTGSKYVGAAGDVFIGTSHNLIIGQCRKLGFHREASGIVLGLKDAISMSDSIRTGFTYSQYDIINTMLPKIEETRNALLEYKDSIAAVNYVNNTDQDVYLTWLEPDDPNYGKDSTYVWKQGRLGRSSDMVLSYNSAIERWHQVLSWNEEDKIKAFNDRAKYFDQNRSFDGGTGYAYSERRDTTESNISSDSYSLTGFGSVKHRIGVSAGASFGANWEFKAEVGHTWVNEDGEYDDNEKTYAEFDYDFNDGNPGTDFTVDIFNSPRGWSDIFLLRGGQSYNPFEDEEKTQFHDKGEHILSYGTEQMEKPVISISTDGKVGAKSATLTDVPAGSMGEFTLHLKNGSTTNQEVPLLYNLIIVEGTNTNGLELLMDGVPMSGRTVYLDPGVATTKVITVRQTDQSVLDYTGIQINYASQFQPFKIYDSVTLNVHFKPSSSPVDLVINEPVVNAANTNGLLEAKITNFDRQFKNLHDVGLQYRFEGSTQWQDYHTFVVNPKDSTSTSFSILPKTGDLRVTVNMKEQTNFPEGTYSFRAFTTTPYDTEMIRVYSEPVTVVKDMTRPMALTTPQPTNGIYGFGDELSVEFNEDIVPGYVGDKNVIVTAKLNQQPVNHEVALQMLPYGDEMMTFNPIFISGDFSMDFWFKWEGEGTIIHQGEGVDKFAMMVDEHGHIVVAIAGRTYTSENVVPQNTWTYIVVSYMSSDMTFTVLAQYGTTTVELFTAQRVTVKEIDAVNYADDNYLYIGQMNGAIHDLSLFNIYRDVYEAAATKYQAKDNYVYGLTNYWPMNEGHGYLAYDARHTHDFCVNGRWLLENENYAVRIDEPSGIAADISRINTSAGESYAIELWHDPQTIIDSTTVIFQTGSNPNNRLRLYYDNEHDIHLQYGNKTQVVASSEYFYDSTSWQHFALNVVRGQAASFYVNGQRTAVIAEADVPPLEGDSIRLGIGCNMSFFDELRIWKAAITEKRLLANMYNELDTADIYSRGLAAYYPFNKWGVENGVTKIVLTTENMAPGITKKDSVALHGNQYILAAAPPLKNAPTETRIIAKPVASERKIVINLNSSTISPRDIEGTTLNITLDDIHDMHGNSSAPIRWTAFVQQNTLKWTKDSVNINKMYGDAYTFDVDIQNKSGNTEYYFLDNMPEWLTLVDSESSDDLAPLKTKTLRFTVDPLVPVGNYEVTIGLQGNNEILEPLRIVMAVKGQRPDWSFDPTQYEHQMTIIGQVYINGLLLENSESQVAAFIDGECRGLASPEKVRGAAYVTMTIFANDIEGLDLGKEVTFRIWDAAKGVAYTEATLTIPNPQLLTGAPQSSIFFEHDKLIGDFDNPAIWMKSDKIEQLMAIHQNWNWISLGVEPQTTYLDHVFSGLNTWSVILKNHGTQAAWSNGSLWSGNLTLAANTMYKMKVERKANSNPLPDRLSITGRQVNLNETPVQLRKGWNWIAYTPLTTMSIDLALAGANPQQGDRIKSQTGIALYSGYTWEGNLKALESGQGYMYYSTEDVESKQFVYPSISAAAASSPYLRAPMRRAAPLSIFNPVDPHDYPDNMTMVVQLKDGEEVVDTAEIAVFIDEECRAAARADNGIYILIIAGQGSSKALDIRACINDEIVTIDNSQVYVSDDNLGTPWEPYVINLQDITDAIDIVNTKSDTERWYDIGGRKVRDEKLDMRDRLPRGVYISRGKKVVIK